VLRALDTDNSYRFRDEGTGEKAVYAGENLKVRGFPVNLEPNSAKLYSYKAE